MSLLLSLVLSLASEPQAASRVMGMTLLTKNMDAPEAVVVHVSTDSTYSMNNIVSQPLEGTEVDDSETLSMAEAVVANSEDDEQLPVAIDCPLVYGRHMTFQDELEQLLSRMRALYDHAELARLERLETLNQDISARSRQCAVLFAYVSLLIKVTLSVRESYRAFQSTGDVMSGIGDILAVVILAGILRAAGGFDGMFRVLDSTIDINSIVSPFT